MDGVFPGRPLSSELSVSTPTSGRLHSPGRGGMAQDGGTRGGTFHGEMDHCRRESRGWTTACSSMPERDGNDLGEDSPKQTTCSCWFARRRSKLISHKWHELVSFGRFSLQVNRYRWCHVVFLWHYSSYFVLFRFRLFDFILQAAALRSIVLQ